jgi:hypothetical protein
MTLSKRDFEKWAHILACLRYIEPHSPGIRTVQQNLEDLFAEQNKRFDQYKFRQAIVEQIEEFGRRENERAEASSAHRVTKKSSTERKQSS